MKRLNPQEEPQGEDPLLPLLTRAERGIWDSLTSPAKIQEFLDRIAYSCEEAYRSPLRVLRERKAHCFDGAVFAAAALRRLGFPPVILELIPNGRDDEHLVALYKSGPCLGAVGQSNFVGLRSREPVYRNLRELVMSYFEPYYNIKRERTLRGYTAPLNLRSFDRFGWQIRDEALDLISLRLDGMKKRMVIPPRMRRRLSPVDLRSYRAGLLGAEERGLFRPGRESKG
jgi:hypothetical protein